MTVHLPNSTVPMKAAFELLYTSEKASQIILHTLQAKPERNHHLKEKKKPFIKEMLAPKLKPCVSLEQSVKAEL